MHGCAECQYDIQSFAVAGSGHCEEQVICSEYWGVIRGKAVHCVEQLRSLASTTS